ncbi:Uncharacterized protein APZ42_016838 [Daphnia magna]|uniref:Uncharacterized protein n=1 Tax=Daphnia magna TaxID=35525 RepID=A0A165A7D8_9CRUS|nr:Uncharacterized protein APZ42_016838 [Daphnia magna]
MSFRALPCHRRLLPRVNRSIKYNATFRPQSSMKRGLKSHHRQSRFLWIPPSFLLLFSSSSSSTYF